MGGRKYTEEDRKARAMAEEMGRRATADDIRNVGEKLYGMCRGPVKEIWDKVLSLWASFNAPTTPLGVKMLIIGGLIYLVSPLDVVPDAIPVLGLIDDVGVITYIFSYLLKRKEIVSYPVVEPQVGDIIAKNSLGGLYQHYGIYCGNGGVVHFAGEEGEETNAQKADIRTTTLEKFSKGETVYVLRETEDSGYVPFAPEEVVARAKSMIGRQKGEYDLALNNCEHFAYWCRYGVKESKQVKEVAKILFLSTGVI